MLHRRFRIRSDVGSGDRGMKMCTSLEYFCWHVFYPNIALPTINISQNKFIDVWEGFHESRRCSRDTYPASYVTKYTSIRRLFHCWTPRSDPATIHAKSKSIIPFASCAALKERCPPRQKSRVERLKAKVEPLLTQVRVDTTGCSNLQNR